MKILVMCTVCGHPREEHGATDYYTGATYCVTCVWLYADAGFCFHRFNHEDHPDVREL